VVFFLPLKVLGPLVQRKGSQNPWEEFYKVYDCYLNISELNLKLRRQECVYTCVRRHQELNPEQHCNFLKTMAFLILKAPHICGVYIIRVNHVGIYVVVPEKAFNRLIYLFLFREFIGHNQQHKVINFSKAGE